MDLRGRKATNSYQILLKLSNAILSLIKNQAYQAPYIHLFGNYIEVVSIISNTRKIFKIDILDLTLLAKIYLKYVF